MRSVLTGAPFILLEGAPFRNALCIVDGKDSGKQRIILSKNQSVVEVLQNFPSSLSNFVARKDHIDPRFDRVFNFDGLKHRYVRVNTGLLLEN